MPIQPCNSKERIISIPNIITISRIIFSILLLCCRTFSALFIILYISAGVTDILDGAVARYTHSVTAVGAKLDTLADMTFAAVSLFKIMPALALPVWVWKGTAVIALVKIVNIIRGYVVGKGFVTVHSIMNKLTGFLLFLFPLSIGLWNTTYSAAVLMGIALFAAIQEGHYV